MSRRVNRRGQPSSDVRKLAPEVASVGATALSFFQVDEASQSSTGEMVVSKEEIFRGPSAVWSMDRLRTCAWLLKALFVLLFLWKGGSAFTRFLKRRTAPTTSSAATGTTGAAAKGGEAKEDAEVGVVPPESFRKLQLEDPTPKGVPTLTATEEGADTARYLLKIRHVLVQPTREHLAGSEALASLLWLRLCLVEAQEPRAALPRARAYLWPLC
eukprot:g9051.t1